MVPGILALVILVLAAVSLYAYAYYKGNKKPDNCPSRFLEKKDDRVGNSRIVVCIGDSITHGRSSCNYVDILARRLNASGYEFVNAGINSELTHNVLQRLDEIIECDPDFVTILIGTNDCNKSRTEADARKAIRQMRLPRRPSAEWFRANLSRICEKLRANTRARIAVLSIPVITEDVNHPAYKHSLQFVDAIREIAEKESVQYLPLRERMEAFILENPSSTKHSFERRHSLVYKSFAQHFFLKRNWNDIGTSNGFNLLTDFVHLNFRGAEMVADLVEGFLIEGCGKS